MFVHAAFGIKFESLVEILLLFELEGEVVAGFAETIVAGGPIEARGIELIARLLFIPGKLMAGMSVPRLANAEKFIFRHFDFAGFGLGDGLLEDAHALGGWTDWSWWVAAGSRFGTP